LPTEVVSGLGKQEPWCDFRNFHGVVLIRSIRSYKCWFSDDICERLFPGGFVRCNWLHWV